jgi:hypothetical protein
VEQEVLRLRKTVAGAGVALVLAGLGSVTGSASAATPIGPFSGVFQPIRNVGNNLCLQPQGGGGGEAVIVQMPCDGGNTQAWQFLGGGNDYKLINQNSGLCMYMNGPVAARSPIIQAGCTTVSNELWKPAPPPPDVSQIMSRAGHRDTNLCVDVPQQSTTPGLGVQIWPCNGTLAQRWVIGF